ncbi:MAG: AAA family ATPase, partial [Chloroflexi bacterium]|nr:AAA family ATPase [Chloroflexota bacterium]
GPEQARVRLLDSIATFLKTASQRQPLVLVLDDLHWADQPSLLLLQFVARELGGTRLLLIGTYRDMELSRQHPLAEALGELTRERLFQRVLLRGLSEQDVARFIDVATGVAPPRGLVSAVYTQTEGNPLFVTEVVRLLVQEGELTAERVRDRDSWTVRIPEGVREVIGRRLNRLSQRCNDTLTVASIIGREFELSQLGRLVEDMSEDRLLDVVDEAQAARVIEELPQTVGRYQFTHALTQETLAAELSTTRRVRLHARIGETLEELYGANAEDHAAELAHHFSEAQTVLGFDKLVHYSLLAGQRALAARAYEEASSHFQRGLSAKGVPLSGADVAPDGEAAALLVGLGNAQFGTHERGQTAEPVTSLTRAFDFYAGSGDLARAVNIGVYSQFPVNTGGELLAKALELVSPDSHEAGVLLSRYIMPLRGDYERAQDAFYRAMAIAEREKDLDLQLDTLVAMACVDFTHIRFDDSLERNHRAVGLAGSVDQPAAEAHSRYDLMHVLYAMGDLEGAAPHATAMLEAAERSGSRRWQAAAMEINENVCSAKGDWQAARSFSDRGLAISPRDPNLLGARGFLEHQLGDFGAGEVYLDRLVEVVGPSQSGPPSSLILRQAPYTYAAVVIPVVARINGVMAWFDVAEAIEYPPKRAHFSRVLMDLEGRGTTARAGISTLAITAFANPSPGLNCAKSASNGSSSLCSASGQSFRLSWLLMSHPHFHYGLFPSLFHSSSFDK